jgi:two-component system response regulator VicR
MNLDEDRGTTMANTNDPYAKGREARRMKRKHILVINGDLPILDLVRELLTEEHYNVTTTNYVAETFEVIVALAPELLIVDLVYGEVAGWDLLERLTQHSATRGIPVVLTSTDKRLLALAAADPARFGTNEDLIIPFDIDDLIAAVVKLIGPP